MPDAGQKTQGTVFDAKADESLRLEALRSAAETIWTELSAYQERLASLETEESQTLRAASDQLSANDASRLKEQLAKYHESLDTALYHDVSVAAKNAFLGDSCRDTWAALAQGQTQLQAQNKVVSKMACEAIQSFADNSDFVTAVHGCQTRRREVYMQGAKLAMRAAGLWRSETVNAYVPAEQITTHLWVEHEFCEHLRAPYLRCGCFADASPGQPRPSQLGTRA